MDLARTHGKTCPQTSQVIASPASVNMENPHGDVLTIWIMISLSIYPFLQASMLVYEGLYIVIVIVLACDVYDHILPVPLTFLNIESSQDHHSISLSNLSDESLQILGRLYITPVSSKGRNIIKFRVIMSFS